MGRRRPRCLFNKIPIDLQTKIFDKLCVKDQSNAMCVSRLWHDTILSTTIPNKHPQQSLVTTSLFPTPFVNLEQLFHWCSQVMCCRVIPQNLIDSCNGLLLFCHNNGKAKNLTHGVYHYYVLNHVTKQCVAVLKPTGQITKGYSYATLVYDPAESWFFQIVRFQGCRRVNVFSSDNGVWHTIDIRLPEHINESNWIKKTVYLNRSIYRLSRSGHLVKIKVDIQENILEQVEVITLPSDCLDNCHWEISVKGEKLLFVMSRGVKFVVCELVECVTRGVTSYSWCNIHNIENENLWHLNTYGELLSFHPYHQVAFFKRKKFQFFCFQIGIDFTDVQEIPYNEILYDYLRYCRPPLLDCSAPFACCLNKEVIDCTIVSF
ncbi:uncharacterized protein [Cicer arietinum]|uniref:uncharacterized protein n=1 Tax=Cicer arietinum TaxID=3827 RepID=UPI00032AC794